MQSTSFTYNERGWMKSSTSDQFSIQLKYNNPLKGALAQYNGNISNQLWGAGVTLPNVYVYDYDRLNRLKSGISSGPVKNDLKIVLSGRQNMLNLKKEALASFFI